MELDKLKKGFELSKGIELTITPINFISVAGGTNSRYIDTNGVINDNKIYGLLENILGYHYDSNMRDIIKKVTKGDKNYTPGHSRDYKYMPIIDNVVKIVNIDNLDINETHIDYASSLFSYTDGRHIKGCRISGIKHNYPDYNESDFVDYLGSNEAKRSKSSISEQDKEYLFGTYPMFYTGTSQRKYVSLNSDIKVKIQVSEYMFDELMKSIKTNNSAYLGNSESIVNVKMGEYVL